MTPYLCIGSRRPTASVPDSGAQLEKGHQRRCQEKSTALEAHKQLLKISLVFIEQRVNGQCNKFSHFQSLCYAFLTVVLQSS